MITFPESVDQFHHRSSLLSSSHLPSSLFQPLQHGVLAHHTDDVVQVWPLIPARHG